MSVKQPPLGKNPAEKPLVFINFDIWKSVPQWFTKEKETIKNKQINLKQFTYHMHLERAISTSHQR